MHILCSARNCLVDATWAIASFMGTSSPSGIFCEELLFAWCYVGSKLPSVIKAISCLMSDFTDIWAVYKPFSVAVRFYYQHQFSSSAQTLDNLSKHFWSCLCICLGFHSCTWKPKWKALLLYECLVLSFYKCLVVLPLFDRTIVPCFLTIFSARVHIKQIVCC